jgi:hypothetical protein
MILRDVFDACSTFDSTGLERVLHPDVRTAHTASFTEVRGGLIYRHATYDCCEAF